MCKFLYRIVKNLLLTSPRWWFYVQIKGLPLVEEAPCLYCQLVSLLSNI